jgi:Protein of unknown function (DUF3443)
MRRLIALAPLAVFGVLVACGGGGGGSGTTTPPPPPADNVAVLTVDAGPPGTNFASVNTPFVSVTICAPGSTSNCQTIDHIEVDTASSGLRIISSLVNSTLVLPQELDATTQTAVVECTVFADGFSWGPVKTADIQIAGETAANVPIQVIGDPAFPGIPTACSSSGTEEDSVATFGANGILGVGPFIEDGGVYFTCAGGACTAASSLSAPEVSNPVASFAADNNGVVVQLPTVAATGSAPLTGSLIFGIGTESNNGLGTATVYTLDPNFGSFSITYKSQIYNNSYLDTGSNANYFVDATIPKCTSGFFCPTSTLTLSATISGVNNINVTEPFSVANADDLFNNNVSAVAFGDLGAPNPASDTFDFGLPFFFGRTIFTAIANQNTPGGIGPYVAF